MKAFLYEYTVHYATWKKAVAEFTGAPEDLLHVHIGLLIFVVAALILRRKIRSPIPLAIVIVFAAGNEVLDWINATPAARWEPLFDFLNTVFWPTILFLLARRWR